MRSGRRRAGLLAALAAGALVVPALAVPALGQVPPPPGLPIAPPLGARASAPCQSPQRIYVNGTGAPVRVSVTVENRCRHAVGVTWTGARETGDPVVVPVGATTVIDVAVPPAQAVTLVPAGETTLGSIEWALIVYP
jgi:hypothetical protein